MKNPFVASLLRALSQPGFVAVAVILFVCAAGLNGATRFMKVSFKKQPVPLARSLMELPPRLGPWVQVSVDEALAHEFQDALMTDKYVFRDYVDSRLVSESELRQFKDKSPDECRKLLSQIQQKQPAAVVNLGLSYYTGLVDTVAHIPDRCYIADGYEPTKYDVVTWDAVKDRVGDHQVRFIVFEDSTPNRSSLRRNVAYFFHCNGEYMNDPVGVRKSLAKLLQKYGYYMKVEVQTLTIPPDQAASVMNDFLTNMLPESEKCLPDWNKLMAEQR